MKHFTCKLILALLLFSPSLPAFADFGPKPHVSFRFEQEVEAKIKEGKLLLCRESSCKDAKPLKRFGPQNFTCNKEVCSGLAYGFAPFLRLVIKLDSGETLESQVFEKKNFDATFKVTRKGNELYVKERL